MTTVLIMRTNVRRETTGDGTLSSPFGDKLLEIRGFQCMEALLTRGYFLISANGKNTVNGAWIRDRERTCSACHASPQ